MEQRQVDLIMVVRILFQPYNSLKGDRHEQVLRRQSPPVRNVFNSGLRK
jgi:hypothetical protein